MPDVAIWHNPSCGSSKNALAYLQEKGIEPTVYKYMTEKPSRAEIEGVLAKLDMKPSGLLRPKDRLAEDAGLYAEGVEEDDILEAMATHARLIQRPIVITDKGAVIARPKTKIDEVL